MNTHSKKPRRAFFSKLAGVGSALMLPQFLTSISANASVDSATAPNEADEWFKKVKGQHRIVYDAPDVNHGFPVIWSWVFYKTNNDTGTPDNDLTAVVVLRHAAIPLAMEDRLWEKYKFGEMFNVMDDTTKAPATQNHFYDGSEPRMMAMGIGGIKALISRGVMFCICDMALTVNSGRVAKTMNASAEETKKDWVKGLLPGVQIVPSGVWAVGRAQEKGCAYCFAG